MRYSYLLTLALIILINGCNLFSSFHEAGSSEDPGILAVDAEAALHNDKPEEALRYSEKGIGNDPDITHPELRYIAAKAVFQKHGIKISTFLEAIKENNLESNKNKTGAFGKTDIDTLLNIEEADLANLAAAFWESHFYLNEIVCGISSGIIPEELVMEFIVDVLLSYGIGNLLIAFFITLDDDRYLENGFVLNHDIVIVTADGNYDYKYSGDYEGYESVEEFITDVIVTPNWTRFIAAQEAFYDAYRMVQNGSSDRSVNLSYSEAVGNPFSISLDTDSILGQILGFVHKGIVSLNEDYGPFDDPYPALLCVEK